MIAKSKIIQIFLIISVFTLTEWLVTELGHYNNEKKAIRIIDEINKEMTPIFSDALITTEVLKEMVMLSEEKSISSQAFNKLSKALLSTYNNVDSLLFLPNGIVTLAYPNEENQQAIGQNVLKDQTRRCGAHQSMVGKTTRIIGPVTLVQNDKQAFILRKSILNEGRFIGFSTSIIYLDTILLTLDNILKSNGVNNYSIVGFDPDNINYFEKVISSKGIADGRSFKGMVNIFNTNWKISISHDDSSTLLRVLVFSAILSILFLVTSPIKYFNRYRLSEKKRSDLQKEAHTDFLTGLINRRGLQARFESLKVDNIPGSIAIFDIDFFKNINDSHGHEVGDIVLVQFSKLCAAKMDTGFIFSRTGGEEFMMLMPHLNPYQAKQYCEQLREAVASSPFIIKSIHIDLTVSIGVGYFSGADDMENALSNADDALYEAKRTGRNRICFTS